MSMPITLMYASFFALFAMVRSFRAGGFRGKSGISVLYGSSMVLYVAGDLLVLSRIAHAVGLKHDNMAHKGRLFGALGTLLVSVALSGYGLWMAVTRLL